jgi:hypothetical protein
MSRTERTVMLISTMNLQLNPEDGVHRIEICARGTAVVIEPLG